jgi:PAS domain S-box-containing protein
LQETVQDLQNHRLQLELQNRALAETQAELRHSLQRYSALYDRLPIGYITVTPHGRIVEANLKAATWLHSKRPTVVGTYLRSFLDPEDAARLASHLQACLQTDEEAQLEVTLHREEDSLLPVQFSSQRTPSREGDPQIHVAITDISALKQTQRMLEDANAELDAFNHSISHDLRAPLVTISNFAAIVLEERAAVLDDEGKMMIQRMRNAALRMEETLKQLLEYSRLTRQPLTLQRVDLEQIVRDLLLEHRGLIHYRNAQITVDRPLPAAVGSPNIVSQVLRNLLTNALKYTLPDQPPRVRISASAHQTCVVLMVEDHGIGIEPKYHEHVFRVFERLHTYGHYPGAGIGLAIVRRAIERMRGRVWLESEPGKGSTFFVELPRA